jgi:putative ABC transport system permease protein
MTTDLRAYIARLKSLARNLLLHKRVDQDLDEEIRTYAELLADEKRDRGLAPEEAHRAARIEMEGIEQVKEQVRDVRAGAWIDTLLRDMQYGARMLLRSPAFSLIAVATLALCIGANTALFSVLYSLLLRQLPYAHAERLVYVSEYWPHEPPFRMVPSPDYGEWRGRGRTFTGMEAYRRSGIFHLTGNSEAERLNGAAVTAGFLDLIGVLPVTGRGFLEEECRISASPVVMLGQGLWQRRFGSSPEAVGQTIALNGINHVIVGVLPGSFVFPDNDFSPDVLTPLALPPTPNWHDESSFRVLRVIARLKQGVEPDAVESELTDLARSTAAIEPIQMRNMRRDLEVHLTSLRERLVGDVRRMLLILQGTVGIVLLIGSLNIANLQIARAISRQREIEVRAALGARPGRLMRQLLTENLLLSSLGGASGLALAYGCLPMLRRFLPDDLHLAETVSIDGAVLGFTLLVTMVTGIMTGLAPLRGALRTSFHLNRTSGKTTASVGQRRLGNTLVITQVALAAVLMFASGLLIRAFLQLSTVDPGFEPRGVLTLRISLRGEKYSAPANHIAFTSQLLDLAETVPGVRSAAVSGGAPVLGSSMAVGTAVEGKPLPPPGGAPAVPYMPVSPPYFESLGIPLVRGRGFSVNDRENSPQVAIINEAFAAEFFPLQDPVGKRIKTGAMRGPWREVVGLVRNVGPQNPTEPARLQIYVPLVQSPVADLILLLRSSVPPANLITVAKELVRAIDPNQPVYDIATMDQRVSNSLAVPRSNMVLMGLLGALALLLAVVGLFGVLSYVVSERTREIAIRIAMGAQKGNLLWAVLKQGLGLTASGLAIGVAGAAVLGRVFGTEQLHGVNASDPWTFAAAALLLVAAAVAASYLPANRAARVDPMVALRHE